MTKKEKQELEEIKELLKKILDKLENLKIEKTEYHYHSSKDYWWYYKIPTIPSTSTNYQFYGHN
jgi:hypothetical protein